MIANAVPSAIMTHRDLLITVKSAAFVDGVNRDFAGRDE